MKRSGIVYVLFVLSCLLGSCTENKAVYRSHQPISHDGWNRSDTLQFNIQIPDSGYSYTSYLLVRTLRNYPYQNLVLGLQYPSDDSIKFRTDTLFFNFSPKTTEAIRMSWGGLRQTPVLIDERMVEQPDTFSFKVINMMNDLQLSGVYDIDIFMER